MEEVKIKTHLIVTDVHSEYEIRWIGKICETKPKFKNGKPVFVIVGTEGRIELNTTDMPLLERCAKRLTRPGGRGAVASDSARIFIVEEDDNEKLLGVVVHDRVKTFAPMYDKVFKD